MNFPQTLAIAQLCPYQGGTAVDQARMFVAMFNDSVVYDDIAVCLAQGYYKAANENSSMSIQKPTVIVKPNPAKDFVEINLLNSKSDFYNLEVSDINDRLLYTESNISCREIKLLNTSKLCSGLYFLIVKEENGNLINSKLVIVR